MDPTRTRIKRSNEKRAKRHALVPDPVEQPNNSSSTLREPQEREGAVRAHLREVWAAATGIQSNRSAFAEPSAAWLPGESLLSDPEEASLRKQWRMPFPAMGQNNDPQAILRSCPSRDYSACFTKELRERYPFTQYHKRHPPPSCYTAGVVTLQAGAARARSVLQALHVVSDDPECRAPSLDEVPMLSSPVKGSAPLQLCPASPPPPPPPHAARLRCDSDPAEVQARAVLLIGVPSTPSKLGLERRDAIRAAWMRDEAVGSEAIVCFVLSAQTEQPELGALQAERDAHGDVLLVDAPESRALLKQPTRYSNFSKQGRGMPTFKQFAFFRHAAATWPAVPFVAKCDDDTAPNVRLLVRLLSRLRCAGNGALSDRFVFLGAINWAAAVPRAEDFGIRLDRCGFGWDLKSALANFGKSWTTQTTHGSGVVEACDVRGAVLPVPYAIGAGYIFSAALLRWLATDPQVGRWVAEAAGPEREALQWQKYEDTTTGYWLSYAPRRVHYVDLAVGVHDAACRPEGDRKRDEDSTYRPPANNSLLVHSLKRPGAFAYAFEHMRGDALPYDHDECTSSIHGETVNRPWPLARGGFAVGCVLACLLTIRFMRRRRPKPAADPWRAVHV